MDIEKNLTIDVTNNRDIRMICMCKLFCSWYAQINFPQVSNKYDNYSELFDQDVTKKFTLLDHGTIFVQSQK